MLIAYDSQIVISRTNTFMGGWFVTQSYFGVVIYATGNELLTWDLLDYPYSP